MLTSCTVSSFHLSEEMSLYPLTLTPQLRCHRGLPVGPKIEFGNLVSARSCHFSEEIMLQLHYSEGWGGGGGGGGGVADERIATSNRI